MRITWARAALATGRAFSRSSPYRGTTVTACAGRRHARDRLTSAHVVSRNSANSIPCIASRFWDLRRNQKLFPHFGEPGTAVFAVEEVEYGGHAPTSLFGLICTLCSNYHQSWGRRCEPDHSHASVVGSTADMPKLAAGSNGSRMIRCGSRPEELCLRVILAIHPVPDITVVYPAVRMPRGSLPRFEAT